MNLKGFIRYHSISMEKYVHLVIEYAEWSINRTLYKKIINQKNAIRINPPHNLKNPQLANLKPTNLPRHLILLKTKPIPNQPQTRRLTYT